MSTLTYKKLQVRYEYYPCQNKPAGNVLLLHSLGLALEESDSMLTYFLSTYNVLRFDLFGHGQSDVPTETISTELFVEQMAYMTRRFFSEAFYIVAGPGIGYMASRFCRRHEDVVAGLVMISPPPFYLSPQERQQLDKQIESIVSEGFHAYKKFLLSHFTFNQEISVVSRLEEQLNQSTEQVHLGMISNFLSEDFSSDFRYIRTPILIIAGAQDTLFPTSSYGLTANYIGAQLRMISDAAHLVIVDNPEDSADAMLDFFTETLAEEPLKKGFTMNKAEISEALHRGFDQNSLESKNIMHVQLLHTFRIHIGDVEINQGWNLRKVKSLFLYLLFHGTATREELIEVFWSELSMDSARNQLRMNLHFLKSLLNQTGAVFLHKDREHVFLQGDIQCDATAYITQLKEAYTRLLSGELDIRESTSILEISPQKLLSHVYDEWYLQLRETIETQYTALCQWTAEKLHALQREDEAAKYGRIIEKWNAH